MLSQSASSKVTGRGRQLLTLLQKGLAVNWLLPFSGLVMLVVFLASLVGMI